VLVIGAGAVLGLGLGILVSRLMEQINEHLVEVMATMVLIYGVYLLAQHLHLSGVIAVAVAGLAVSNFGLRKTSATSGHSVTLFWEIIAFLINSVVFLLIGFELRPGYLVDGFLTVLLVFAVLLAGRALIVCGIGILVDWKQHNLPWRWRHLIVWGGLRGAVPVALALGLPANLPGHDELVNIVFGVVLFSLLGQGLTMPVLIRRLGLERKEPVQEESSKDGHPLALVEAGQRQPESGTSESA
jgi:monovalent cation:H+ antiporter, CPA1 family